MNLEFEKIRIKIKKSNNELNGLIVEELLAAHSPLKTQYIKDYDRYKTEKLPIKNRIFEDTTKINNKLNNDFVGEIIDQVVGYLFGTPINYSLDKTKYSDDTKRYEEDLEVLERFTIANQIKDVDAETGKRQAINGITYRLCYIDKEKQERIKHLPPEEVILLGDMDDPEYGIWYYPAIDDDGNEVTRIEFYREDKTLIYDYFNGTLILKEEYPNLFDYVPIIAFPNNEELQNDFVKVESLIDAYDRLISDGQNEFEEFRQAYMIFKNCILGETEEEAKKVIEAARRNGAFQLPGENTDVLFLTKTIDTAFIEFMKKTLSENIYRFSKSVDMSAENFSGSNESGESRKYKLIALENKASMKERKFEKSLNRMFKVICSAWNKKGYNIDYLHIYFDFKRTLPIDYLYLAQVIQLLEPYFSKKTLFSEMPFVDDPDYEIEQKRKEREEEMLSNPYFQGFVNTESEKEDEVDE